MINRMLVISRIIKSLLELARLQYQMIKKLFFAIFRKLLRSLEKFHLHDEWNSTQKKNIYKKKIIQKYFLYFYIKSKLYIIRLW